MAEDISKKITISVEAETDEFNKNIVELNQTLDSLLQRQKQLTELGKENTKMFNDIGMQVKQAQAAIEGYNKAIGAHEKTVTASNGSLVQNKALLESLKQQYDKLTDSQGETCQRHQRFKYSNRYIIEYNCRPGKKNFQIAAKYLICTRALQMR